MKILYIIFGIFFIVLSALTFFGYFEVGALLGTLLLLGSGLDFLRLAEKYKKKEVSE